jgi:PAS domain S-box-containing protein
MPNQKRIVDDIETYSQDIVDTVREPLLMLDTTLRVRSANRAFYQTFQVSPAETENRLIYELGNGQWDIPALRTLLEDVVPKSSVFNDFELEHTFPVIGRRVMLLNARKLRAGSHAELLVLAMEDVTERRRSEADLKAIDMYAQNIVDTVREPLLTLDTTLRVQSANRAFYQMFKVSPEETENHLVYELGNGQWDIPDLRTLLEDIVPKSSVFNDFELEYDFPSIGRRVMLLNARKLQAGHHGELLVLAMEDVTERKRAAEQQRAASAYARSLIEASPDPLVTISPEGKITDANQATELVTGIERQHLIGTDFSDYFTEPGQARTGYQQVFSEGYVRDYPLALRHVSGQVTDVLYNGSLYRNESGKVLGVIAAARDVTERKRVEEEVALAKEAAETANKTKSLFLANMSHELRTPLNAILGYSEMLQEEAAERHLDEFGPDLERIKNAGKHLLALINDILDLSKIEAGKMELYLESFDIAQMIDEIASTVQPMVEKNSNALIIERAPNLGYMYADQIKVRQAVSNLLSNAVKFTQEGHITLLAKRELMDDKEWIVFEVTDTGIGLSSEQIVKLFKDFTQADASTTRKFGGTGLGLALTRRFCQMMGGDVTVKSVLNEGSVFAIKLPAVIRDPAFEVPPVPTLENTATSADCLNCTDPVPAGESCILVIDDDPAQRDLLFRFFSKEGFCVRTASGGEMGLRLARQFRPLVITLDVMMPDMDGWTVLTTLMADENLRDIPVIMLTMVDDPARGFTLGAAEYATKPVNRKRLSQILKKHTGANSSVLIVEEDPSIRNTTRSILEREGWKVSEAENGALALECMQKERPTLVLLDLMMPEMDGFEFADLMQLHPEWQSIPLIVVTAKDLTADERRTLSGSVQTVLHKPGSRDALLSRVRDIVKACAARAKSEETVK